LESTKHQLVKYSFAQRDVIECDSGTRGANKFIQVNENASLFVQYYFHLGDTKEDI